MSDKTIVCTGMFANPLHEGHLWLLEESKRIAEERLGKDNFYFVVVVNNDEQVRLKGSCPFHDDYTRLRIIQSLKDVDDAILCAEIEKTTITKTLKWLKPKLYFKGGDRTLETMDKEEIKVCREIGCEIIYGVGGTHKENSSSSLIKNAVDWYLEKEKTKTLKDFLND